MKLKVLFSEVVPIGYGPQLVCYY